MEEKKEDFLGGQIQNLFIPQEERRSSLESQGQLQKWKRDKERKEKRVGKEEDILICSSPPFRFSFFLGGRTCRSQFPAQ